MASSSYPSAPPHPTQPPTPTASALGLDPTHQQCFPGLDIEAGGKEVIGVAGQAWWHGKSGSGAADGYEFGYTTLFHIFILTSTDLDILGYVQNILKYEYELDSSE